MSFYKCNVCQIGTDLARQCGLAKCSHLESRCKDHGGDYEAIKAIQVHMKTHEEPKLD